MLHQQGVMKNYLGLGAGGAPEVAKMASANIRRATSMAKLRTKNAGPLISLRLPHLYISFTDDKNTRTINSCSNRLAFYEKLSVHPYGLLEAMEPSDHPRVHFDILTAKLEHGALRILRIPLIFMRLNRHYLGNTIIQNRLAEERYRNRQCCAVP